jgi:outer membrane protein OmpA-like peptidoglycan-associated protein
MRDHILKTVAALAAFLPILALPPMAAQDDRRNSFEFSAGVGVLYTDNALASFLGANGFSDGGTKPSRLMPAGALRLGYAFDNHFGFSIGISGAKADGVHYVSPLAALTYTWNLNARTSPFLTVGTQFTRITGNDRVTHPTWGAHVGLGLRSMMSPNVALRIEGRMGIEHYEDLPGAKTAYNSIATIGLSYFTRGRRAQPAADCPVCAAMRVRVDTVRVPSPPPPPVVIVRRCEHGIAPVGLRTDQYGCILFSDTLLLEMIHFDFDKSELTPTATPILERVAESMLAHPEVYFEIAGHTDSVGTFAYNYLLSARRANTVRSYLIQQGVPAWRMTAVGYGEGFPIAPNATVEGRALNRRGIELRVKKP